MASSLLDPATLKRRIRRNPTLRRLQTMGRLRRGADPFLVISAPKTGSTTIEQLARASTGRPFVKLHSVTPLGVEWRRRMRRDAGLPPDIPELQDANYVQHLLAREPGRRWDIVTTIREPIARSVSAFFHVGRAWGGYDPSADATSTDLDDLTARLVDWPLHPMSCHWIRWELSALTGIDFFDRPFDVDAGFEIRENDRFRVLVVRAEDLDRVVADALRQFFPSADPVPERTRFNEGASKAYSGLYGRFLAEARLPEWFVDALHATEQSTHYYRPDELARARERWTSTRDRGVARLSAS
jgi:hypothetical protein